MHYVLIAGDHFMVRFGLSILIREILRDTIIEEAVNTDEMTERMRHTSFHLVILDFDMPGTDPAMTMRQIADHNPDALVVVTGDAGAGAGRNYLERGARGYIPKDASEEELRHVLLQLLDRRSYAGPGRTGNYPAEGNPFERLSPRESEIILLLLKGKSYTEISRLLQVQYTTVRTHKQRIFEKLNIHEGAELLQLTQQYRLPELSHS